MNILIADDHEPIRIGLIRIIKEEFPSAIVEEASNGIEAENMGLLNKWDLIIMDISMPHKTGLDVLRQLRAKSVKTPILICSYHPENQYALRMLKEGANGYLSKGCSHNDFIDAIQIILSGKTYVSKELSEKTNDYTSKK